MNTPPTVRDSHITEDLFLDLALEDLEKVFIQIDTNLDGTFQKVLRSAKEAAQIEAQRVTLIGLENQFKEGRQELKAVVDALIYHAIFPEEDN